MDSDYQTFLEWHLKSNLGKAIAKAIDHQLQLTLPTLFGYSMLQMGFSEFPHWLEASPIVHKIYVEPSEEKHPNLCSTWHELPLMSDCLDVVFVPYILSFSEDIPSVLREIERVLIPNGHVVIIGFNPLSLWGMTKPLKALFKNPIATKMVSTLKLRYQLHALGFHLKDLSSFLFRPLISNQTIFEKLLPMEVVGKLNGIYPGNLFILIAQKQVASLTPIKPIWSFKNVVIGKRFLTTSMKKLMR